MHNSIYQNRFENLRDIIERQGGQSAVAAKLEVSKQYINLVGSDKAKKTIGNRMARKIETVFGLPIGSIDHEVGTKRTEIEQNSVTVPLLNAVVSLGSGASVQWADETVQSMCFSKRWLRHNTEATSFNALAIVSSHGDNMAPTFAKGSILLVDTAITQLRHPGVYVLLHQEALRIQRIQPNLDGSFSALSDNPAYQSQVIANPKAMDMLVLGSVLIALNIIKL